MAWYPRRIPDPEMELLGLNWIVEHHDPETEETHCIAAFKNDNQQATMVTLLGFMPVGLDQKAATKMADLLNDISHRMELEIFK